MDFCIYLVITLHQKEDVNTRLNVTADNSCMKNTVPEVPELDSEVVGGQS